MHDWDPKQTAAMFDRMSADGFDLSLPLEWGFFFMAATREPLEAVVDELAGHDYRCEIEHRPEEATWVLRAAKVEALTADRLHRRNVSFNELAEHCGADLYDGWDVGPVEEA